MYEYAPISNGGEEMVWVYLSMMVATIIGIMWVCKYGGGKT